MRLSSHREFIQLLEGLQVVGFVVPFSNYEQDMKDAGIVEHIHNYECRLNIYQKEKLIICSIVFEGKGQRYSLVLFKGGTVLVEGGGPCE